MKADLPLERNRNIRGTSAATGRCTQTPPPSAVRIQVDHGAHRGMHRSPPARYPTCRVAGFGIPIAPRRRRTGNAVSGAETGSGGDAICDAVKRPRGRAWFRARLHPHAVRGFPRLATDASGGRGRRRRTGDNQDETRAAPRVRRRLHAPVVPHPAGRIPILKPRAQQRQLRSQQGSEIIHTRALPPRVRDDPLKRAATPTPPATPG